MNSFSFNRFCKTFRWFFGVNLRSMMIWSSGYVVGVFLGEMLFFAFNPNSSVEHKLQSVEQFCTIFIIIALTIGACTFLSDFNKKSKREAFLMLPASNLEKYLTAILYIASFFTTCVLVSFALGDSLRMVIRSLVYGDEWRSTLPMMVNWIPQSYFSPEHLANGLFWFDVMKLVDLSAFFLWIHSIYTLGGTLLRKYSYVVTSVFVIFCMMLFGKVMTAFNMTMFHTQWDLGVLQNYEIGTMSYILAVALPVFAFFNYWASFQIFKGYQLITNKWTNYDILKR